MKTRNSYCDPELLSRFYDGEITPEENEWAIEHISTCQKCQNELKLNEELSKKYKEKFHKELSAIDPALLEKKIMERVSQGKARYWTGIGEFLTSMRFLVPAAAVAGMLFFLLTTFRGPVTEPPPSAIINSFTGDVSSVMILETPQSHQTIIWINET